jgi:hypothetical protein
MKHLKIYEKFTISLPKKGQYVIMKLRDTDATYKEFVENNIGIISAVKTYVRLNPDITVEYENVPEYLFHATWNGKNKDGKTFYFTFINDIEYISDYKDELESILMSKKYNI